MKNNRGDKTLVILDLKKNSKSQTEKGHAQDLTNTKIPIASIQDEHTGACARAESLSHTRILTNNIKIIEKTTRHIPLLIIHIPLPYRIHVIL